MGLYAACGKDFSIDRRGQHNWSVSQMLDCLYMNSACFWELCWILSGKQCVHVCETLKREWRHCIHLSLHLWIYLFYSCYLYSAFLIEAQGRIHSVQLKGRLDIYLFLYISLHLKPIALELKVVVWERCPPCIIMLRHKKLCLLNSSLPFNHLQATFPAFKMVYKQLIMLHEIHSV